MHRFDHLINYKHK